MKTWSLGRPLWDVIYTHTHNRLYVTSQIGSHMISNPKHPLKVDDSRKESQTSRNPFPCVI
ncbi:hypothetical protein HanIR_Chr04g0189571 [Helianthus annuus]|nr:hypothetical protein HanIR_Chr04g0189571 [Helianthus annuus]